MPLVRRLAGWCWRRSLPWLGSAQALVYLVADDAFGELLGGVGGEGGGAAVEGVPAVGEGVVEDGPAGEALAEAL